MSEVSTAVASRIRQPGGRLGNYRISGILGQGGMSVVYRATDVILGRDVALKILSANLAAERPERFQQFLQEAKSAAKLHHPNVVTIYQIDQHEGTWYVAMELVEGKSLKEIVEQGRPLAVGYCVGIITTAAQALARAHENGILHRDIKPSNIMVSKTGVVKITDFGLATKWELEARRVQSQQTVGTPAYMAPELCYGYPPSPSTDMYALGMTLYVILTNNKPYASADAVVTMQKQVSAPIPNLLKYRPDCHPALQRILNRLMAKDPQNRYEWLDQAIEDLQSLSTLPANGKLPNEEIVHHSREAEVTPSVSIAALSALAHKVYNGVLGEGKQVKGASLKKEPEETSTSQMQPLRLLNRQRAQETQEHDSSASSVTSSASRHRVYSIRKSQAGRSKLQTAILLIVLIVLVLLMVLMVVWETQWRY